jgi:beta-glucanase (GH16 family)
MVKSALMLVVALMVSLLSRVEAEAATSSRAGASQQRTDACGSQPLKADGSRWVCTFSDGFNDEELNRHKWVPQTHGFSTGTSEVHACYVDDPANIAERKGKLKLTVRKLAHAVPCASDPSRSPSRYAAGSVSTYHLFSQRYGRFQARIKVTATRRPGLQETFWLWPDDRSDSTTSWPANGEIDVVETYSRYPDLGIPYLHYTENDNGGPIPFVNTAWTCLSERGVYNTWTVEWSPSRIKIMVNGRNCLVNNNRDPAFDKPYIVAFTQALGTTGNVYNGTAPMPATMYIDYVRVWK